MKKIFVVTFIRNESDIIESFCRYNLLFCDGMLIFERGSIDHTNAIIKMLIAEGLPIYLEDDKSVVYPPNIREVMALRVIDEYGADMVVSLDADEFLYHIDGKNPREVLETLDETIEYQVPWRTYIYNHEPEIALGFLPKNFARYRNPALDFLKKVIVSKYLIKEKKTTYNSGAHFLFYPQDKQDSIKIEIPDKLVCAHFPLRSKAQLLSKAIPFRIFYYKSPIPKWDVQDGQGFQYNYIWDDVKANGEVTEEMLIDHSLKYSVSKRRLQDILPMIESHEVIEGPMDISFCSDKLGLRYTDYQDTEKTFLRATLTEIEAAIMSLPKREWETIRLLDRTKDENAKLNKQNNALTKQVEKLSNSNSILSEQNCTLSEQNYILSQQISEVLNSRTWKTGKKIQQIFRFFIPIKGKREAGRKEERNV